MSGRTGLTLRFLMTSFLHPLFGEGPPTTPPGPFLKRPFPPPPVPRGERAEKLALLAGPEKVFVV